MEQEAVDLLEPSDLDSRSVEIFRVSQYEEQWGKDVAEMHMLKEM
jgi:hypothetical protein